MKKIGEIKGIPVVEGNINEVTKNQIHYKEDSGSIQLSKRGNDNKLNNVTGSSGGGSSSGEYYLFDKDLIGTYFPQIGNNYQMMYSFFTNIKAIVKVDGEGENKLISPSAVIVDYTTITNNIKTTALKYDKIYDNGFNNTLKECLERMGFDVSNFDKAFPRITEEEFYDLNKWSLEDYK